ncbi:hypothetical protein SULYE_1257 [Sulfurihydrogenibium yellowstonense SS-5]|uniref:Uncharacterized protein n=1 Tax=Sulfurihydrogenibium yellowstonense SS-5 TaxID=432331 RepID=C4FL03_9AQUI|nr:hypothetical protein SULYE_1257 [Sulfurihydrogenibium yellowstonense SS-5]
MYDTMIILERVYMFLLIITLDHSKNKYLHSVAGEESPTCKGVQKFL